MSVVLILGFGVVTASSLAPGIVIEGAVRDRAGRPLQDTWIGVFDANWLQLAQQTTGVDGRYRIEVPPRSSYYIYVSPNYDGRSGEYLYQTLMTKVAWVARSRGQTLLHRDFALPPAGTLAFKAYDHQGNLLRWQTFIAANDWWWYVTDPEKFPQQAIRRGVFDHVSQARNYDYNLTIPAIQVAPGQGYILWVLWEVSDFGKVLLRADNEGQGFRFTAGSQLQVIHLNYELARSRLRWLEQDLRAARTAGYDVPIEVEARLTQARRHLRSAAAAGDEVQKAAEADQALAEALWAHEALVLARARQEIRRYRQPEVVIQVVDPQGWPIRGAIVEFQQQSHDFLFGTFMPASHYDRQGYDLMGEAGINYVTLDFPWSRLEPREGVFNWGFIDHTAKIEALVDRFHLLGHNLVWFTPGFGGAFTPRYLYGKSFEELLRSVRHHVTEVVTRYKDHIHLWNALNEGHASWANAFGLSQAQMLEIARTSASAVKDVDPEAKVMLNMASPLGETIPADLEAEGRPVYSVSPYTFAQQAIQAGIDFEIIGLQFYYGGVCCGGAGRWPTIDLATLSDFLDWYSTLGKTIFISEVSVPSIYRSEWSQGWWHHPWDEATQAEWLEGFYTVAFAKPYVRAITWWDAKDSYYGFIDHGGLLHEDYTPKAAYTVLKRLLTETWHAEGRGITDAEGRLTFQGFAGEYEVTISASGYETVVARLHIHEGAENAFTITLQGES